MERCVYCNCAGGSVRAAPSDAGKVRSREPAVFVHSAGTVRFCSPAAKLISETFNVLSVTIWLFDEHDRLAFAASTSRSEREANDALPNLAGLEPNPTSIRGLSKPFDLEKAKGDYAESLRQISSSQFRTAILLQVILWRTLVGHTKSLLGPCSTQLEFRTAAPR